MPIQSGPLIMHAPPVTHTLKATCCWGNCPQVWPAGNLVGDTSSLNLPICVLKRTAGTGNLVKRRVNPPLRNFTIAHARLDKGGRVFLRIGGTDMPCFSELRESHQQSSRSAGGN